MKYVVIGGGISGCTVSYLLTKKGFDTVLYESSKELGGLIKCDEYEGHIFHRTGGHVFNTRSEEVLKFFTETFGKENFYFQKRKSSIRFEKYGDIPYPIENNLKFLPTKLQEKVLNDLLSKRNTSVKSFQDVIIKSFGHTLNEIYFSPYNSKIWQMDVEEIPAQFVEDKFPNPSFVDLLLNNINNGNSADISHGFFYYPKQRGSNFYIDVLSKSFKYETESKYSLETYDESIKHIYTGNLKSLAKVFPFLNTDLDFLRIFNDLVKGLAFHGTTSVFVSGLEKELSWEYLPDSSLRQHRIIYTDNLGDGSHKGYGTVEFSGTLTEQEIHENVSKLSEDLKIIKVNSNNHTYPIQKMGQAQQIRDLKDFLNNKYGIELIGRFAEWEYMNMDVIMLKCLEYVGGL